MRRKTRYGFICPIYILGKFIEQVQAIKTDILPAEKGLFKTTYLKLIKLQNPEKLRMQETSYFLKQK